MRRKAAIHRQCGFTLIEVLIATGLLAVLVSSALPGWHDWVERTRTQQAQRHLLVLLSLARDTAVTANAVVTLCGSADLRRCDGNWSRGTLVFIDLDADGSYGANETLLRASAQAAHTVIVWRSFRNLDFLQFTALGFTNHQSGSFLLCPQHDGIGVAQQLIVSASGRIRAARDSDGDGVVEDAAGQRLSC